MSAAPSPRAFTAAQHCFVTLMPDVLRYVRRAFAHLPAEARDEAVQETLATSYWFVVLLARKRRLDLAYATVLARYAVAHVRAGRRFTGGDERNDVSSRHAQRVHGFGVRRLDRRAKDPGSWHEAVAVDRRTPIPEQAAFRLDFPRWLATHSARDRAIARELANGEQPMDVAARFGLSRARISQLRTEFAESWRRFHEPRETAAA